MKKTLIALAALASVSAFAQSSVTLSGTVAMGYSNSFANTRGITQTDGNVFFSGTEDLGGGLKASFKTGFDLGGRGTGGQEDTSLSLAGDFGTVTAKSYESHGAIEATLLSGAYNVNGAADFAASGIAATKNRGFVGYTSNPINNTSVTVGYATFNGTNALNTAGSDGDKKNKFVLAANYAAGPLRVYGEYDKFDSAYPGSNAITGVSNNGVTAYTLFAVYDFGAAKAALGRGKVSNDVAVTTMGVSVPLGAVVAGVDQVRYNGRTFTNVGVNYNLSKRTAVKLGYGKVNDAFQAAAGTSTIVNTTQSRIALVHNF